MLRFYPKLNVIRMIIIKKNINGKKFELDTIYDETEFEFPSGTTHKNCYRLSLMV
jgi:hypothetical protein